MAFASMFIFTFLAFSAVAVIIFLLIFILIKFAFYIFQSIGLYKISKYNGYKYSFIAWIPCISQYIIGRYSKNGKYGILYSILTIMKYILIVPMFYLDNPIYLNFFLAYLIIYFIYDILIMDMFYKKVFKNSNVYTIVTACTLGFIKPVFIFMANFKIKNNVE